MVGEAALPDGRKAVPVFQLIAERYLDPHTRRRPSRRSAACRRTTIRSLAAEIGRVAFERR